MTELSNRKVAVLATNGFEDSELTSPVETARNAGATVSIIAPETGSIEGKNGTKVDVDLASADANAADYDALILPGGTSNADSSAWMSRRLSSCARFSTPISPPP